MSACQPRLPPTRGAGQFELYGRYPSITASWIPLSRPEWAIYDTTIPTPAIDKLGITFK